MVVDLTKEAVTANELDEWLRSTNVDEPLHGSTSSSPTMSSLQYTRQQLDDDPSVVLATAALGVQEHQQQQQPATEHTIQKKRKGRHDLYNNRRRSSLDFPSDNDCFGIDEHTALAAAHNNGLVDNNINDEEEDVEILRRSSSSQMHNHNEYNERDTCANDINDDDQQSYCQEDEHQIDNSIIDELAREEYEKVSRQQDPTDEHHVIDNSVIDELVREEYEKTARLVRASENDVTDDDIMSVVGSIIGESGGSSSHNNPMHTTTGIHKQSQHAHRMNLHLTGQQQQYLRRSSTSSLHHNIIGEKKKDDSTLPPLYRRANTLPSSFATEGESPFVTENRQSLSPLSRVETVLLDVLRNESCDDSDSQLAEPYDFKPKGNSSCSRPILYSRKDSYNSHQESCHGQESQCTQEYPASPFSTRIQQQHARPSIISLPRSASSDLITAMEQSQQSQDFITQTIGDASPIDMMTNFQYSRKGCLNMISRETKHSRGLLLSVLKNCNPPNFSPGQQVEYGIQENDYGYSRRASTGNVHSSQSRYPGQRPNTSYVGNNLYRRSSTSSAYNFKRNSWKEQEMMKSMLKRIPPLPGGNKGEFLRSPDTNNPIKSHTHFQYPPPSFQNLLGGGKGETTGQMFDESAVKAELERIARQTRELERQHEG